MTKVFCIFTILSFLGTQAMAMSCDLGCFVSESLSENSHDCCPSSDKDSDDKESKCMGEVNGICFHEFSLVKTQEVQIFSQDLVFNTDQDLLADLSKSLALIEVNSRYSFNYHDNFLAHKSQTSLYLLKDQFLI